MTHSTTAETPTSEQRGSKLVRVAAVWLFGLLLSIAAAIITIQVVNANLYGPQQPVRDYLQALQDGDGSRALGLLGANLPNASAALLDGQALKTAAAGISDIQVGNPTTLDNGRVKISVNFQMAGSGHSSDFTLEPVGSQWIFFNKWKFVPTSLPVLDVSVVNQTQATINGVDVPMPAGKNTFSLLYPGSYEAGYQGKLFTAKPGTVLVDSPISRPSPVTLAPEPSAELVDQVNKALKQYTDQCAQQKVLRPSGCPLNYRTNNRITGDIAWTIVSYPQAAISAYNGSWVIAPLKFKAEIKFSEKDSLSGAASDVDKVQEFFFSAKLNISGEKVEVTPVVQY
ncbi:zinc ribbon domain-containing protein [Renibacterium salmoninarum]|uniref:hypothetical protein n=1 Tax=Renibacterium salmoninarum TaxID=1646 RepID=UPI000DF7A23B|nr:hypothetical protein [Renibacterium salmoninarum]